MTILDLGFLDELPDRTPQGIAGAIARAIRAEELHVGDRLPTVRDIATQLGVSPATVSTAWQALRGAGLVQARGRAGTYVSHPTGGWLSPRHRGLLGEAPGGLRLDLSRGTPDPALLPDLGPALRRIPARATIDAYQEEPVVAGLGEVLRRSWPWAAETITVVNGATDGVARALEQCVGFGDRVVVESPTFPPFFDLVESLGARAVPVALDADGIVVASLMEALRETPAAILLQPRAHNPTGASMSVRRASQLARVLTRASGVRPVVIEDDHSGPISTRPAVSLGQHLPDQVVHVRSFSKSHGPDLRIAALGGPAHIVEPLIARRMLGPGWTSRMTQNILLDLLTHSRSMDEVAEARRQYFGRQQRLTARLAAWGIDLPVPDGINLWLPVRDERAALAALAEADLRAAAGAPFHAGSDGAPHVRVTGGLVHPEDLEHVAGAIAAASKA